MASRLRPWEARERAEQIRAEALGGHVESSAPPPWDGQDTLHALGLAAVVVSVLSLGSVPLSLSGVLLILGASLSIATWDPRRHGGEG